MDHILEIIKARRSHRLYEDIPVRDDDLDLILEAGRYAPSGGNSQSVHFIVIKNKKILEELTLIVEQEFAKMEIEANQYSSIQNSIKKSKAGGYRFFYDAPVLIVTANKLGYPNNIADTACALENMMLEATALKLGSCWINQLRWLDNNPVINSYLRNIGLKADETVCGGLALGFSKTPDLPPREIKRAEVTYVN